MVRAGDRTHHTRVGKHIEDTPHALDYGFFCVGICMYGDGTSQSCLIGEDPAGDSLFHSNGDPVAKDTSSGGFW